MLASLMPKRLVLFGQSATEHQRAPATVGHNRLFGLRAHARALGRVFESIDEVAAFFGPTGVVRAEARRPGFIRIAVATHFEASALGCLDALQHGLELVPVGFAADLGMGDQQRGLGAPRDLDGFVDGFEQLVIFVADVGDVGTVEPGRDRTQLHQFVGRGHVAGEVLKPRGQAHRTLFEGLLDQALHHLEFFGRR
jgi:hypothetical protein